MYNNALGIQTRWTQTWLWTYAACAGPCFWDKPKQVEGAETGNPGLSIQCFNGYNHMKSNITEVCKPRSGKTLISSDGIRWAWFADTPKGGVLCKDHSAYFEKIIFLCAYNGRHLDLFSPGCYDEGAKLRFPVFSLHKSFFMVKS